MPSESVLAEVVAACIGGSFSASALYPLEVLKTKIQAESKQSAATNTTTTGSNNDIDEEDQNQKQQQQQQQQQISPSPKSSPSAILYAKDLYEKEGIAPFYAGISTSAFQSATEKALYFFAYTALKNMHNSLILKSSKNGTKSMGTLTNLIIGCLAEWAHLPITLPIDCWTTKIQTSGTNGKVKQAPFAILVSMLSEGDGIRGMYKGIQAYTVLCLKPAIQYTVFEQVKAILLIKKRLQRNLDGGGTRNNRYGANEVDVDTLTAMEAFILGMIARTIATIVVFPYLRAKVMLQSSSQSRDGVEKKKVNIPAMVTEMYRNGGVGELFQGIGPELTRGVFSTALMMMVKEKISFIVRNALNVK